jgi:hypothetical protein
MPAGQAMLVAAGGALAAYAVSRSESSSAASELDAVGYTSVTMPADPVDSAAEPAARRSMRVPCGAPRVAYADIKMDGAVGASFLMEWASQTRSLGAKFGTDSFLGLATGRPKLTADCCVAWIDEWLRVWWGLRDKEPARWPVFLSFAQEMSVHDRTEVPQTNGAYFNFGSYVTWSPVGYAWRELVRLRNLALWARGGNEFDFGGANASHVASALKTFAFTLDAHARTVQRNAGEEALEVVKDAAKGAAGGVVWVLREVLGPTAAAAAEAAAEAAIALLGPFVPYVVIGGVLYLVVRSST